jgi:hypothetical protein
VKAASACKGVRYGVPFEEYRRLDAWSSSDLKAYRKGPPARVVWERSNQREHTEATLLGSAVHCAILEPDAFLRRYVQKPEGMKFSTKDGKAWRDEHADREILPCEMFQRIEGIVEAVLAKSLAVEALGRADGREVTIEWDQDGAPCKARPDILSTPDRAITDLKVSRHAERGVGGIAFHAFSEGWLHQLAHYRTGAIIRGLDIRDGRLIVVSPAPPHFVWCIEAKRDALDLLELQNIETVRALQAHADADSWPGTEDAWLKIEPPASALIQVGDIMGLVAEEG